MLEERILGRSGLKVTALGYGAMELRNFNDPQRAERILNTVLDNGIRFIDTSQDYKLSETMIGQFLSHRRDEYVLATKCACNLSGNGPDHIFTPEQLAINLEDSLRKLRTDHIDLWQLHCATPPDLPGKALDPTIQFMLDAKKSGKVGAIGISFKNGKDTDPAYPNHHALQYGPEMAQWGVFDTIQVVFGGLTPQTAPDIVRYNEQGLGVIVRGVLKRYYASYEDRIRVAQLDELFDGGEDVNGFLVRYALTQPGVGTAIIGSENPDHIVANIRAAERGPLAPEVFAEAKKRLGE